MYLIFKGCLFSSKLCPNYFLSSQTILSSLFHVWTCKFSCLSRNDSTFDINLLFKWSAQHATLYLVRCDNGLQWSIAGFSMHCIVLEHYRLIFSMYFFSVSMLQVVTRSIGVMWVELQHVCFCICSICFVKKATISV